jgi:probable HAF family extracellular repeat protein
MTGSARLRRLAGVLGAALSVTTFVIGAASSAHAGGPVNAHAFFYSGGVMTDIGTLPGDSFTFASGLNSQGQVVGDSSSLLGQGHAFLWKAQSGMVDLSTLIPANSGWVLHTATGINDSGQVTGIGDFNGLLDRGDVITLPAAAGPGSIIDIGTMPGGSTAEAMAINASGQVVGRGDTTNPNGGTFERAFLYSGGTMTNLGALTGAPESVGLDINDAGEVAGVSGYAVPPNFFLEDHAFLYKQGAMQDLGKGSGLGINSAGQVVGTNAGGHAALYSAGTVTDLGTLPGGAFSNASGINLAGTIVGGSDTGNGSGTQHAVVFGSGTVTDIGTLPGFDNSFASRVNATGQIIGVSYNTLAAPTPITLSVPTDITVPATGPAGAVVTFSVSATGGTGPLTISCTPASGATFPVGTTTVNCSAGDASGNSASASFLVNVLSAAQQLSLLQSSVLNLNVTIAGSLVAKLQSIQASLATGATTAACNQLNAFINEVQAQSGKKISAIDAGQLITAALNVRAVIGCP